MSLGPEVGLGQSDIVLDGDPAPPKRGTAPLLAHVYFGQRAGWIKTPLGTKADLGPRHILLDGNPVPPPKKRHSSQFSAHVYYGQTVAHLSYD